MRLPSRRARIALLAGCATFAAAAPASAAPSASIDGAGKLTVTFAGTDAVTLAAQGGNVKLGATELSIPLASVKTIEVLEDAAGTGANTVDLSAVTAADHPQLTSTLIKAAGGADALTGTQLSDRIEGGRQNDTMHGRDGNDTLVWNPGEDSDVMNGGDGIDTVLDLGATPTSSSSSSRRPATPPASTPRASTTRSRSTSAARRS